MELLLESRKRIVVLDSIIKVNERIRGVDSLHIAYISQLNLVTTTQLEGEQLINKEYLRQAYQYEQQIIKLNKKVRVARSNHKLYLIAGALAGGYLGFKLL